MRYFVVNQGDNIFVVGSDSGPTGDWGPFVVLEVDESWFGQPVIFDGSNYVLDTSAQDAASAQATQDEQLKTLSDTFDQELGVRLMQDFGTLNIDRAIADRETWQDMVANPGDYIAANLVVRRTILNADGTTLYGPGELLNTTEKITNYATRLLEIARAFGIWRIQRLDEYEQAVEDILNS
jgi:hypothetical protein